MHVRLPHSVHLVHGNIFSLARDLPSASSGNSGPCSSWRCDSSMTAFPRHWPSRRCLRIRPDSAPDCRTEGNTAVLCRNASQPIAGPPCSGARDVHALPRPLHQTAPLKLFSDEAVSGRLAGEYVLSGYPEGQAARTVHHQLPGILGDEHAALSNHCFPAFAYWPIGSFFLASTEITGSPFPNASVAWEFIYSN